MAVLWSKQTVDTLYEVRKAGDSIRLYSNGVFHSQYNPNHILGGQVWDMLLLPSLLLTVKYPRILVLGVGGGAAMKHLLRICTPKSIVGVDIDPTHIQIAHRFFKVPKSQSVNLICADAIEWMKAYKGPKFDLIIDDLFSHSGGQANRVIEVDKAWASSLTKHLGCNGVLAVNFESTRAAKRSHLSADKRFNGAWRFSIKGFENCIACYSISSSDTKRFKAGIESIRSRFGAQSVKRYNTKIVKTSKP